MVNREQSASEHRKRSEPRFQVVAQPFAQQGVRDALCNAYSASCGDAPADLADLLARLR